MAPFCPSLITFPKIKENKKIYYNNKNIGSKDCFLTLNYTDDVNFAIVASNKLERKLILGKINNLRLLKRGNNNDIYMYHKSIFGLLYFNN